MSGGIAAVTHRSKFELTQVRYTALLAGNHTTSNDGALRKTVAAMVTKGDAEVVETMVCTTQNYHTVRVESVTEFIYPTEFEPPELPPNAGSAGADEPTGPVPTAWDQRPLGSILEVEPILDQDTGVLDVRFVAEVVRHVKNWIWLEWNGKHGTSHIQTPVFHTLRCGQSVFVMPGQPLLAATLTPKGQDGMPDATRKILVFLKCVVIPPDNHFVPVQPPSDTQRKFDITPFQVGRPPVPTAWDTRKTGMIFDAEASCDDEAKTITVRLVSQWVGMTTPTTWVEYVDEWGDASDRRPTFTSLYCHISLTLAPGRFALAAVLTPQPEPPPPAVARKVLVFVRADLPRQ